MKIKLNVKWWSSKDYGNLESTSTASFEASTLLLLPIVSLLELRFSIARSLNFSGETPKIGFYMKFHNLKFLHLIK